MANTYIPENLKILIQQYLTDGVLSDKERQVILNKAERIGLNRDEIDLYLDTIAKDSKTCPYCGEIVPKIVNICPHCQKSITEDVIKQEQEVIRKIEERIHKIKNGWDISYNKDEVKRLIREATMFYGDNPKVEAFIRETKESLPLAVKKGKRNMIINFIKDNIKIISIIVLFLIFAIFTIVVSH